MNKKINLRDLPCNVSADGVVDCDQIINWRLSNTMLYE